MSARAAAPARSRSAASSTLRMAARSLRAGRPRSEWRAGRPRSNTAAHTFPRPVPTHARTRPASVPMSDATATPGRASFN